VTSTTDAVRRELVAHLAGLPPFPGEVAPPESPGDHVMGVTVHAWLAGLPIRRWGAAWFEGGDMSLRFRRPLAAGDRLTLDVADRGDAMTFELRERSGAVVADGVARGSVDDRTYPDPDSFDVDVELPDAPVPPEADALRDRALGAIEFDFDARRDLALASSLDADDPWRALRVAHPAWVSTGVNALLRRAVDFPDGHWTHAGSAVRSLRPIPDGTTVRLVARVERLFDAGRHRFADVGALTLADGVPAMVLVSTIVYGATSEIAS
jgi:hypothetical protein